MSSHHCECSTALPFHVLRWARLFRPRMRDALIRALQERQATKATLTTQDISDCIEAAWAALQADMEVHVAYPPPDLSIVQMAQQQAREGQVFTIDEILNELP